MQGWLIFKHAVLMLWGNKGVAVRLAAMPLVIATVLVTLFISTVSDLQLMQEMLFPGSPFAEQPELMPEDSGSFFTGVFGFSILSLIFTLWVIVAWHRFILLEEEPEGWVTPFNGGRVLAYFGQILKLMLIGVLLSIPVGILIGIVTAIASGNTMAMLVVAVPLGVILFLMFYRLSVILPASAIGKPITLRQAWSATEGSFLAIFVLVVVGGIFQTSIQFLGGFLTAIPMLGFAVNLLISFALGMINASILTTLYGHYVQGRDL